MSVSLAPPEWLDDRGREVFIMLVDDLGDQLEHVDQLVLNLAAAHYTAAEAALKDLAERGPLVEGDRGMVKNPANQIAREQSQAFRQYCAELGLSPAARKRLAMSITGEAEDDAGAGILD